MSIYRILEYSLNPLNDVWNIVIIAKIGLFEWKVMPFGLKNAMGTFSRTMKEIFDSNMSKWIKVFMDDVNVHNHEIGIFICYIFKKILKDFER